MHQLKQCATSAGLTHLPCTWLGVTLCRLQAPTASVHDNRRPASAAIIAIKTPTPHPFPRPDFALSSSSDSRNSETPPKKMNPATPSPPRKAKRRDCFSPARRRQPTRPRRPTHLHTSLPAPSESKPLAWLPDRKRSLPVGRPIQLDSNSTIESPFFTHLHYDVRRAIYTTILADTGFRQHIFCPSVSRMGNNRHLIYTRYLVAKGCSDVGFEGGAICGHWECENARDDDEGSKKSLGLSASDLVALMRTSKFAYLEISEFLYNSVTFTFSSFPEMTAFIDNTPASIVQRIRFVAFIAHVMPSDPKACMGFLQGTYFETEDPEMDGIEMFNRFPNLRRLEVNFFPSMFLAISDQMQEIIRPLERVQKNTEVVVRVPEMLYPKLDGGKATEYLYLPFSWTEPEDGEKRFKVLRPGIMAGSAMQRCKAY